MTVCAALLLLPLMQGQEPARKLETFLLLPEPRELRTKLSILPEGALKTVLTPARETTFAPGISTYSAEEFRRLGIGQETFLERARTAADRRLAKLKPDLIKDSEGRVKYAVYRGAKPLMASLLMAPSLPEVFEKLFGPELWVALPDRHSLFIFPAKPEVVSEYTADLAERYHDNPHAASAEIFVLKKGEQPRVLGSFGG